MEKPNESLELVALFSLQLVIRIQTADLVIVDHDSIVFYFTKALRLFQIVPIDLIGEWDVVAFALAANTHVDVVNPGIVVHEDDFNG